MTFERPDVEEILFTLDDLCGLGELAGWPGFGEVSPELARAVVEEAAKIAEQVLAPLNPVGDREGARLIDGRVRMPGDFKAALQTLAEGGWIGLPFDPAFGGMGLPWLLNIAVQEVFQGANMAFALCPMLTQGAVEAIAAHGSEDQKARWLPPLVAGRWAGTMCLTEPQAGSDLGAVRCRAVPDGDRHRLFGQKIFITYGDHDLTDNIVHLVLARTPDAPPGVGGISLFLVPKRHPDDPGRANDLRCLSLERKLGIHASPTAVMAFGETTGAVGERLGDENRGLAYMFMMMNRARLMVGLQGLAVGERARRRARAYAAERIQGTAPGFDAAGPILRHPDVRRTLLGMTARGRALRGLAYRAARAIDAAARHPDPVARAAAGARLGVLTPIVKGWGAEEGFRMASAALQVHGGSGYIEETGAARDLRDVRITAIYEGTTGIQANDLLGRKLLRDGGAEARRLLADADRTIGRLREPAEPGFDDLAERLRAARDAVTRVTDRLLAEAVADPRWAAAAADPYLHLWARLLGGLELAEAARVAAGRPDGPGRRRVAAWFAAVDLAAAMALAAAATDGAAAVAVAEDDDF